MIFERKGRYHEESKEGYTVCVTRHGKTNDQWNYKFTAWYRNKIISVHDDSQDARDACAEHYKENK